jgi:hypothetical protein
MDIVGAIQRSLSCDEDELLYWGVECLADFESKEK